MDLAVVTGAPLAQTYADRLEALGLDVLNGSRAVLSQLGVSEPDCELTEEELGRVLSEAKVYVYGGLEVHGGLEPASASALGAAKRLELIAFLGTGWADAGCVDAEAARSLHLRVSNTPHANARSTAEMAIALMLTLERAVVPMNTLMRKGEWTPIRRRDVQGRTIGIVGLGHVGSDRRPAPSKPEGRPSLNG